MRKLNALQHQTNFEGALLNFVVDDQHIGALLIYFMQIIDLYSDLILSIQFRLYYLWSVTDDQFPDEIVSIFNLLFILSMAFVVVPYFGNIISSMNVIQQIANDKVMSGFTKKYFQVKATCIISAFCCFKAEINHFYDRCSFRNGPSCSVSW